MVVGYWVWVWMQCTILLLIFLQIQMPTKRNLGEMAENLQKEKIAECSDRQDWCDPWIVGMEILVTPNSAILELERNSAQE